MFNPKASLHMRCHIPTLHPQPGVVATPLCEEYSIAPVVPLSWSRIQARKSIPLSLPSSLPSLSPKINGSEDLQVTQDRMAKWPWHMPMAQH